MRVILRYIAVMLMFLCGLSFFIQPAMAEKLTIGMEGSYPPFDYMGADGNHHGFEPELVKELCEKLKVQCEIVDQSFDSMIPGLQANKYDIAVAAMTPTLDRKKQVIFTDTYYKTKLGIASAKGNNIDPNDVKKFKNALIGVQGATTSVGYVQNKYVLNGGAQLRTYQTAMDALLDLSNGRLDYVVVDSGIIQDYIHGAGSSCCKMLGELTDFDNLGMAMALNKKNIILRDRINVALKKLKEEGVIDKLAVKYLN